MSEIDTSSGGGIAARLARLKLQTEQNNDPPSPRAPPPTRLINEVPFSPIGPRLSTPRRPSQCEEPEENALTKLHPTVLVTTAFPTKKERPPPPPIPGRERAPMPPPPQTPTSSGRNRSPPPPPPSQPPAAARRNISPPPPPPSQPPAAARRNISPPPPPPSQPPAAIRRAATVPPPPINPPLPARKASNASMNSVSSVKSVHSLPPAWTGNDALPVQPKEKSTNETVNRVVPPLASPPALPPRLPPRRPGPGTESGRSMTWSVGTVAENEAPPPTLSRPQIAEPTTPKRRLPPPPSAIIPPLPSASIPPPLPSARPKPTTTTPPSPPPIPLSSRPRPPPLPSSTRPTVPNNRPTSRPTPPLSPSYEDPICLHCRDFTLADTIAAAPHLSRTTVPSLQHLATALSAPFPNSTLDVARAIFTWLHHNIAYDTASFFGGCVKPKTPQETLQSGVAVCQGYAELFVEIAQLGGAIDPSHVRVVGGGSKGFGHRDLKPGDPIPEYKSTHAWNAIYIPELGRWHLIDSCWGAGHVTGLPNAGFHKNFKPELFTSSVEEFGRRHFPTNPADQLISKPLTWEEFITLEMREGKRPMICGSFTDHGFTEQNLFPKFDRLDDQFIAEHNGKITFSFAKSCPHVRVDLDKERLYVITIEGIEEQWVCKVPRRDVEPGDWQAVTWEVTVDFWNHPRLRGVSMQGRKVRLMNFAKVDGKDATGLTAEKWRGMKGKVGYMMSQMVGWNCNE